MVVSLRRLLVDESAFVVLLHLPIEEDEGEEGDGGTRLLSKKEKERLKKEKEKVR